ncbi:hypothetical protein HZS61_011225 [Fusarium oxysporum f. sp. conglutinans]|uniref:Uncharacterized protein n=1 Tax=Fusarium oxysporum f. sp. conglutinans TaxID=100902 RepID=A0A8H6GXS1_FUSOX|nr:hypothetical protein HZS61_011225 [Fusarium oxysporum f. sp. conglutinans]
MKIHEAHQRYGPVVRIAPNELSFADPSAVRDIYMTDAFQKEENFYYSVELIKKSRQNNVVTPFFRSVLYGEKDGYLGRPLTDSEVAEECMSGMFGGTGTTANTFVFLLWATLQHPEVVEKLKSELRYTFSSADSVIDYQTCARLPYLQAVINEALRKYPTIVAIMPRIAKRDTTVASIQIPKGTVVGIQNYTIHRWEPAFPEPESFLPERWLDGKNSELRKEAFVPFSVGPRRCIGMNLAQMELSKLVAAFFLRFDATIDPSMRPEDMRMFDSFSAGPVGRKLLVRLKEEPIQI